MPKTLLESAKSKRFGISRKLENYFDEYDFNFSTIRNKAGLRILEIGVQRGGSLAMWQQYFPAGTSITGIDIDKECRKFEEHGVHIRIGSQDNPEFLLSVEKEFGPFDIVIDDGGHTMKQQIVTFQTLFPLLNDGGIFVIEDLHTSYWRAFGGRLGKRETGIGLIKDLIDRMHFWASDNPRVNFAYRVYHRLFPHAAKPRYPYDASIRSINIGDSICFIHKGTLTKHRKFEI